MALSFKQLCQLLDCKQAASLKRILKARGIRWIPDRNGKPTTSDAEYDRAVRPPMGRVVFTRPPCPKKNKYQTKRSQSLSRPGSVNAMAPGTTHSTATDRSNYVE